MMREQISIYLDGWELPAGRRAVDPVAVDSLAESMARIGLQTPITVYIENGEPVLISGAHRVEAARKLGWEKIDAVVMDAEEVDRQLWEIDENLIRRDLSELDRSTAIAKRADLVAERELFANIGNKSRHRPSSGQIAFNKETAKLIGASESTVEQAKRRGRNIVEDVKEDLRALPAADNALELNAIAALEPDEQRQAVERMKDLGESAREAKAFIRGEEDWDTQGLKRLKYAWTHATQKERKAFRSWIDE